jgi:predicted nucleotidyltransferase
MEVRLFGSRARDEARPDSDIDLLIIMDTHDDEEIAEGYVLSQAYALYNRLGDKWQHEIGGILGTHVSLVWYPPSDPQIRYHLDSYAVSIWSRDRPD